MAIAFCCCCIKEKTNRVVPIVISEPSAIIDDQDVIEIESSFQNISTMELVDGSQNSSLNEEIDPGHYFKKKTFHKPTYCHHCADLLWGLTNQGMQCTVCGFVTHERCRTTIMTPCNTKASTLVQVPSLHTLIKLSNDKKRYCNVCRHRIDNSHSFQCQACSYYIHDSCRKQIVHCCKNMAGYVKNTAQLKVKHYHHWCEGHLPLSSKCRVCSKTCASNDCLTGLRCSWCLTTVHSYCVKTHPVDCDFGNLRNMVLPPYVLQQLNPSTSKVPADENGWTTASNGIGHGIYENGDSNSSHILRIYEGSIKNPHGWRNVSITEQSTTKEILKEALHKFQIKDEKTKYFLILLRKQSSEVKLGDNEKPWVYIKDNITNQPQIFLRHVKLDNKDLKLVLHAGSINSSVTQITMKVNMTSPSNEIVIKALDMFKLEKKNADDYCITQMRVTSQKVLETSLGNDESIYEALVERRKQTIQELHSTRFYLQPKDEPLTNLSLFIERLPVDLTKHQYQYLLTDVVGKWDDGMNITALFPTQGAVVIEFDVVETLMKVISRLNEGIINGKKLRLHLLPEIKEKLIPKEACPIIVFVNGKSGGGQGWKLLTTFKRLLNPYQVVDILDGGPLPIFYMFRNVKRFRILICGGDGTFGWVLSCLDEIRYNILRCKQPASALLPLGTGNDLARVLNWGSGYSSESPLAILMAISYASETMLDRWNVVFDSSVYNASGQASEDHDPINIVAMNNYFGVGIDAEVCLEFHMSREENPEKFTSRFHNKGVYFKAGVRNLTRHSMTNLQDRIEIIVDGEQVNLPSIEGVAVNNINSWGGGSDPWGKDRDEKFAPQRFNDGLLEVIGFTGVYHMGKIKSGLSTGIRIAQGTQINIKLKESLPVQVDGEPWLQVPCSIMIRPTLQQARMLVKPSVSPAQIVKSRTPPLAAKFEHENEHTRRHTVGVTNWYH